MIDIEKLIRIPGPEVHIPNVEELTRNHAMLLIMEDGTAHEYTNEYFLMYEHTFKNIEEYANNYDIDIAEFDSFFWSDEELLQCIRTEFPEVVDLFLTPL